MSKSKSAFKTIAEVADELKVATHVLRFWETKFTQIKPMKVNGWRYYRPDDVEVLKLIKNLLYGNRYTIEGAQQLIKEKGLKNLLGEAQIQKDFFAAESEEVPAAANCHVAPVCANVDEIADAVHDLRMLREKLAQLS